MTKLPDDNDLHQAGQLDPDPFAGTVPHVPKRNGATAHTESPATAEPVSRAGKWLRETWGPVDLSWLDTRPAQVPCLLEYAGKGVLPRGTVGMIAAAGGIGKTFAMTDLALAVSAGASWLGAFHAKPGRVLMLVAEEDLPEARRRVYWTAQALQIDTHGRELVTRNLHFKGMRGQAVGLVRSAREVERMVGGDLSNPDHVETDFCRDLRAMLAAEGPWDLIIFDPLSRFAAADSETENSAGTRYIGALERFAQLPGSPVVMVAHHTSQSSRQASTSGGATDATAARGVTGLTDGPRWVANLEPVAVPYKRKAESQTRYALVKGLIRFRETKRNSTAELDPFYLCRGEEGALLPMSEAEAAKLCAGVKAAQEAREPAKATAETTGRSAPEEAGDDDQDII